MLRVALTGGIASGKSAVAAMLRAFGAHVSQSDEVARLMMQPGALLFQSIAERFGPSVVTSHGELDRALLTRLAFQENRLQELNALVHPAVLTAQARWMDRVGEQDRAAVAVVESALVLETPYQPAGLPPDVPWRTCFDRVVVVSAEQEVRQARYVLRAAHASAVSTEDAAADFQRRVAAQWTDRQREALADIVLHNDTSLANLEPQVAKLYASLRAEAAACAGGAR